MRLGTNDPFFEITEQCQKLTLDLVQKAGNLGQYFWEVDSTIYPTRHNNAACRFHHELSDFLAYTAHIKIFFLI